MSRVQILDPRVADRIAAGEVVERPASAVKELVENSLDAGARSITVEVLGAGSKLIRVSDDGAGMEPEDAALAVRRFATSKIASTDDLERIATFGFRGEALPSIAAVSRLTLTTRPAAAEAGTRVQVGGGEDLQTGPTGAAPGTVVAVESLFFNTPARRKFLKSPSREFALIVGTLQRVALAAPAVAFRLRHEGRETLTYAAADPEERLAQVLGRDLADAMIPVRADSAGVTVSGWAVRPERARPGRSSEYLFVNRRPIQSRMLSRAAAQGYAQLLPVGVAPVVVLFLDVDPGAVDVNIHPRKQEVRFEDEHRIFPLVSRAVRDALLSQGAIRAAPPLDAGLPAAGVATAVAERVALYGPGPEDADLTSPGRSSLVGEGGRRLPPLRPLGQVLRTYILAEVAEGLVLIDQHAAHERILYERLLREAGSSHAGQGLTAPLPVELSAEEAGVLDEFLPASQRLGFDLEPFGGATVLVRAVPAALSRRAPDRLLHRALAALVESQDGDDLVSRLAIATACHTAVRAGDPLSAAEMSALLTDLELTEDPFTCFHGRPTMVWLARATLERWFLRR